jgi:uncharacterized membrane protein
MNKAHLHLIFNHFPVITPIVGLTILVVGTFLKSEIVKRTAYGVFILGAIFTFPAGATGEGAEKILVEMQLSTRKIIHTHEEISEIFSKLSYLLGLCAAINLWSSIKDKSYTFYLSLLTFILALGVIYFAQKTSTSGGEIRHTEIRN